MGGGTKEPKECRSDRTQYRRTQNEYRSRPPLFIKKIHFPAGMHERLLLIDQSTLNTMRNIYTMVESEPILLITS
jgi:hypothetical protein